jgi:ribonuclease J
MRFCIHRGTQEIGGTCVEIESQGKRLVLDIGLPLDDNIDASTMPLHPVPGFDAPDPALLGVIISHPHQDHYGLAHRLPKETPFLIGKAAQAILEAADLFTPAGLRLSNVTHLENRKPIALGPFTITPFLVDHSAYDSYALLVEADGQRLFYSGDFRTHGRKARLVEELIANPPQDVDVLLMEGTTLGRPKAGGFPTEDDLVPDMIDLIEKTRGLTLVWASGQNIDRLVTLYKACRKTRRQLVIDAYTATVLQATDNPNLLQHDWTGVRVFLPRSQKFQVMKEKAFKTIDPFKPKRINDDKFPAEASQSVMLFRPSMIGDLDRMKGLEIGRLIVSVWGGYLQDGRNEKLLRWCESQGIAIDSCHTSGHAHQSDLIRLRECFTGSVAVPVHLQEVATATELFAPCKPLTDGQWFDMK